MKGDKKREMETKIDDITCDIEDLRHNPKKASEVAAMNKNLLFELFKNTPNGNFIKDMEDKPYFESLYKVYLEIFRDYNPDGEPVCYSEWVNNELKNLRLSYRRYLKEAVLEDLNFDESTTEDFWDFCEEEIKSPMWEV